ncbi:MAG: tetratricopeptide repeat protein [bacterium]
MAAIKNKEDLIAGIFLNSWRPYAWIAIIGSLLYFKSLFFNFVYFDDNSLIIDNFFFLKDIANFPRIFTQSVFHVLHAPETYYRPMLTLSFMLDAQMGGLNPFFYHLTNILLHLIASILVFVLFVKLKYRRDLSFIFSIIFTVHPVLTQAVAWIPGRNDPLLAVFVLSAFISFLGFMETRRWRYYLFHMIFWALAIFTKESAVALILLCGFYLRFMNKEALFSFNEKILAAGWFAVLCSWFLMRQAAIMNPIKMTIFDMIRSLWLNLPALVQFTGKMLLPFNLSVLPIIQDTSFIYGIVAIIVSLTALLLTKERRYNHIIFGLLWFLLFLLPAFIKPNPGTIAGFIEHRTYLPMIGLMMILLETGLIKGVDLRNKGPIMSAMLVIVIFSFLTFAHLDNFKNRISFWENAVRTSPHHPMAHRNLGAMYYLDGTPDKAELEYKKALELNPSEPMAHNNLGLIYMNKNRFTESQNEFIKELAVNPLYDNAHYNLGLLYFKQGRSKEAEAQWKKTVEINPDHVDACRHLAAYYYAQNELALAKHYVAEIRKRGVPVSPEVLKVLNLR